MSKSKRLERFTKISKFTSDKVILVSYYTEVIKEAILTPCACEECKNEVGFINKTLAECFFEALAEELKGQLGLNLTVTLDANHPKKISIKI